LLLETVARVCLSPLMGHHNNWLPREPSNAK
jgi:hypothetical protein